MIVAGVVLETLPGAAGRVAARLLRVPGLEIRGGDGGSRLAATWTLETGADLETQAERLLETEAELVGIYPTFVGDDEAAP